MPRVRPVPLVPQAPLERQGFTEPLGQRVPQEPLELSGRPALPERQELSGRRGFMEPPELRVPWGPLVLRPPQRRLSLQIV